MQHCVGGMVSLAQLTKGCNTRPFLFSCSVCWREKYWICPKLFQELLLFLTLLSCLQCFKSSGRALNKAYGRMGEERKWILTAAVQAEGESLGGRRKINMPFGDFGDKQPSKAGGTQHMLWSVTQHWGIFWSCKPKSHACAYNMPALLHLHLLRRSLPLHHLSKT